MMEKVNYAVQPFMREFLGQSYPVCDLQNVVSMLLFISTREKH